jgi:MazG family protein
MVRLHQLTRVLREQCPWDQEQDHASLVRYLVEETYEVVDALHALDANDAATDDALVEELGDLLYQVEFHAIIAEQEGRFTMADVARGVHDKLVRRHPHVFPADGGLVVADDAATVKENWDNIKHAEKGRTGAFDGLAHSQPALAYADAVQRRAAKVGFDWPDVEGALPKIAEEASELRAAARSGDDARTYDELGDLLFAVVNVARHLGVEPETALRAATVKFRRRFEQVEALARERDLDMRNTDLASLDALWDQVKAQERQ